MGGTPRLVCPTIRWSADHPLSPSFDKSTPALPLASVPPGALALGPAAAAEGEFQHAAPRLPP